MQIHKGQSFFFIYTVSVYRRRERVKVFWDGKQARVLGA